MTSVVQKDYIFDVDPFLAYIRQRRARLRQELSALDAAERVYLESGVVPAAVQPPLELDGSTIPRAPTIQDAALEVLKEAYPQALSALEILNRINARWAKSWSRTSLSPQLTRLKLKGLIDNLGREWRIARMDTDLLSEEAPNE